MVVRPAARMDDARRRGTSYLIDEDDDAPAALRDSIF